MAHKVIAATITTTAKTSSPVLNIEGWNHLAIELPTCDLGLTTATCNVYCKVAQTATGTFRKLAVDGVYSGVSGIYNWEVPSTIGNQFIQVPVKGYNYAVIELSQEATAPLYVKAHVSM